MTDSNEESKKSQLEDELKGTHTLKEFEDIKNS